MKNVGFSVCAALGLLAFEMSGIVVKYAVPEKNNSFVKVEFLYEPAKRGWAPKSDKSQFKKPDAITVNAGKEHEILFKGEAPSSIKLTRTDEHGFAGGNTIFQGQLYHISFEQWNDPKTQLLIAAKNGYQFIVPSEEPAPPAPNPYTSQRSGMAGGSSSATGSEGDSKSAASTSSTVASTTAESTTTTTTAVETTPPGGMKLLD